MKETKETNKVPTITFSSNLDQIGTWTILRLPKSASSKLSSRGIIMIKGTMNGLQFQTVLEPDGKGSHWFRVDKPMRDALKIDVGDSVKLVVEQTKEWIEPVVPEDLKKALVSNSQANAIWKDITTVARWEWIRWINSTKNLETRKIRIEKSISKLKSGKRRPCCFNTSQCTVPDVSTNGVLLESI